jgi:aerobic-type carbon monoxide dehydrogenase small subunit (CoxS/CutS family)
MRIGLRINGANRELAPDQDVTLLSALRDQLFLTGAKYGCGEGECGACTVLVNGEAVRSCMTRLSAVADKEITTIEGLERDGALHPVQTAFLDAGALQCGYCTPGMVLSAVSLLHENATPSRAEIIDAMNGNICRCGVYSRILDAIDRAAKSKREGQE